MTVEANSLSTIITDIATTSRRQLSSGLTSGLLSRLARLFRAPGARRDLARYQAILPVVLQNVQHSAIATNWSTAQLLGIQLTDVGGAVAVLGQPAQGAQLIVKLGRGSEARASLQREATVLKKLRADPRLDEWRAICPAEGESGEIGPYTYVVEESLPGRPALPFLQDEAAREPLLSAAVHAIHGLHHHTSTTSIIDDARLERWTREPVKLIRAAATRQPWAVPSAARLTDLECEIHESLRGRSLTVSWIHGDFWPGNLLVDDAGVRVTGLVDWDMAGEDEIPAIDVLHLLIYSRSLTQRKELGEVVRELLNGSPWTPSECKLLDDANVWENGVAQRTLIELYWLRHIGANLVQRRHYARNWLWIHRNIESVLGCI